MDEVLFLAEILANPLAALALVLITGLRGDWIFGWLYREQQQLSKNWKEEAHHWQEIALKGTELVSDCVEGRKKGQ